VSGIGPDVLDGEEEVFVRLLGLDEGTLCLCPVKDVYSSRIVGYFH
jgi:hypothetical protein